MRGKVVHNLVISPERTGSLDLAVYVMSDCYLGLDQQFSLPLTVEAGEEIFYSDEE